jgi:alpha-L-fucosidase 2
MKLSGGTYSNLLCAHPPFQIDGNFGGTAGIAEMLLQSHADRIHVLPALPAAWKTGSLAGFKARGAFEIGLTWQESRVTKISIKSLAGNTCRLLLPNRVTGEGFTSAKVGAGWLVEFATVAGRTYFLENRSTP